MQVVAASRPPPCRQRWPAAAAGSAEEDVAAAAETVDVAEDSAQCTGDHCKSLQPKASGPRTSKGAQ